MVEATDPTKATEINNAKTKIKTATKTGRTKINNTANPSVVGEVGGPKTKSPLKVITPPYPSPVAETSAMQDDDHIQVLFPPLPKPHIPVSRRLKSFTSEWYKITKDQNVLNMTRIVISKFQNLSQTW